MDVDKARMELLRPAADGLRRALQRMDDEDVPAALRVLADSSQRRLPPPLLKRALAELESSEWLRAETAAAVSLAPDTAAHLFIARPDGWESQLESMAAENAAGARRRQEAGLEKELAAAQRRVSRLEQELKKSAAQAAARVERAKERAVARLASAESARRRAEDDARAARHQVAEAEQRMEAVRSQLEDAEARLETMRQLLERERKSPEPVSDGGGRGWFPTEPVAMAVDLDRIVQAVRRPPTHPAATTATPGPPLKLPDGVRPDRAEAVQWLTGQAALWLVDGYNLAFQIGPEPGPLVRQRVVAVLGQLVALSPPASMAVVAFDSSEGEFSTATTRRVRAVFVPSADEWLMNEAAPGAVVVTSDRRVREACAAAGAVVLWSEALAAWMSGDR